VDLNANAYRIVKGLTEEKPDPGQEQKRKSASAAGRVGGRARAKRLTAERRRQIAISGSEARWKRTKGKV